MVMTKWSAFLLALWIILPCCATDEAANPQPLPDVLQVESPASAVPIFGKKLLWSLALHPEDPHHPAIIVNTALLEGSLYVADSRNVIHAIDRTSGRHHWILELKERCLFRPVVNDRYVAFVTKSTLTVARKDIGARLYERSINDLSVCAAPAMSSSTIYLPCLLGNMIETIGIQDANLGWRYALPDAIVASPAVINVNGEKLVVASMDGSVVGLPARRADGGVPREALWKNKTLGPNTAHLAITDHAIILASEDGFLYAIDPNTGERNWSFPGRAGFRERPVVAGKTVFASNADALFAVDASSGRLKWSVPAGETLIAAMADGGAVVQMHDRKLAMVNAKGEVGETMALGESGALANPYDGTIYLYDKNRVYAFGDSD